MVIKLWIILSVLVNTIFIPFTPNGADSVQVAIIAPYSSAPACSVHNSTVYHGLWDEVNGCHHDHSHNASPLEEQVQVIFGDYTQYTGQEVSYPWQTFVGAAPGYPMPPSDPALLENSAKHEGNKFDFADYAYLGICPVRTAGTKAVPNAWLVERHSLGHKPDFMARVHSFWAMVRFCIPDAPGEVAYLYTGGWQDFGQRVVAGHLIPVPGNPVPAYGNNKRPYIFHSCTGAPECRGQGHFIWNSGNGALVGHRLFGFRFDGNDAQQDLHASEGFTSSDPQFDYVCHDAQGNYQPIGCEYNNTSSRTVRIFDTIPASMDLLDGVGDERVNYEGYTDRWGNIVQGCTQNSLDCVPLKLVNMPVGYFDGQIENFTDEETFQGLPEYDIYFDDVPSGWLGPEN